MRTYISHAKKAIHEKKGQAKLQKMRSEASKRIAPTVSSNPEDDEETAHVQHATRRTQGGREVRRPRIFDDYL